MQYARSHLHTPLFVVLGHEGCGAVQAALEYKLHRVKHLSRIQALLQNILPGLPDSRQKLSGKKLLAQAVEANVRWSMRQLQETPEGSKALKEGARLVGAVYEIASGHVRFLP